MRPSHLLERAVGNEREEEGPYQMSVDVTNLIVESQTHKAFPVVCIFGTIDAEDVLLWSCHAETSWQVTVRVYRFEEALGSLVIPGLTIGTRRFFADFRGMFGNPKSTELLPEEEDQQWMVMKTLQVYEAGSAEVSPYQKWTKEQARLVIKECFIQFSAERDFPGLFPLCK